MTPYRIVSPSGPRKYHSNFKEGHDVYLVSQVYARMTKAGLGFTVLNVVLLCMCTERQ